MTVEAGRERLAASTSYGSAVKNCNGQFTAKSSPPERSDHDVYATGKRRRHGVICTCENHQRKNHMKTITKLIYLLTSALSILALMLVSCSSGTTASTTRQTTTTPATTPNPGLPSQPTGYQDTGAAGAALGGPASGGGDLRLFKCTKEGFSI